MAQEFQTSFIPKKTFDVGTPAAPRRSASVANLISFIAVVLFILSLLGAVGMFLYERFLVAAIESKKESLERAKNAFEPELIRELSRLDAKLRIAQELLNTHVAPSGIFDLLESLTLETVRFTDMNYMIDDKGIHLRLQGEALSFASVALQSDEFGKHRSIQSPAFSDLTLDDRGNVEFVVEALISPSVISYRERASRGGTAVFEVAPADEGSVAGASATVPDVPMVLRSP